MVQEKSSPIVGQCIEKLKSLKKCPLLIPASIHVLAARFPPVMCNYISEELAQVIMSKDVILLPALASMGILVNDNLYNYFLELPKGETIMIHHYEGLNYFTTVAQFQYDFNGRLIFNDHDPIECSNVIAAVRIPALNKTLKRSLRDDDHVAFNILTKRAYSYN